MRAALDSILNDNVIINGHRIACGAHGNSEGEPVLLIHGTPSHSYIWRNVLPGLTQAGYRVYLFDLLGFGASERPRNPETDTSVGAQDAIITGLLDYWNLSSVHLVAHDIGGAVGMRFAIFHPEKTRSLTLIDTVSFDSWPSETWRSIIDQGLDSLMQAPRQEHRERLTKQLKMVVYDKTIMEGEVLKAYLDPITGPIGQPGFFQHQVAHYDSRYTEKINDRLHELGNLPVQILWGENDQWQPLSYAEKLHSVIPDSQLKVLPEAGHFLMEDKPVKTSGYIDEFISNNS